VAHEVRIPYMHILATPPQPTCIPLAFCVLFSHPAGEKLSESRASDVRELCNTLLSAYLIQLLDTGLLHADPHPGNLIRTTDGKICVLDFGLMTEVTPEQRIALVEYIAHLSIQVSFG
jgi:RIO-like serine/threonine protein kinase